MDYTVRAVRSEDWQQARQLRLEALQDPAAPVAFLEAYEEAVRKPDAFWQGRTDAAAEGRSSRQFVAERPDGSLAGTVTVLVERAADDAVRFGSVAETDQAHVVAVFVRPQDRGRGVVEALFREATEWSWSLTDPRIDRVRLYVHEANPRAAAVYRRLGFVPSGRTEPVPGDPSSSEIEYEVRRQATPH
ncbi:GNAT family N-acetyltransferase [Streptomyces sp. B1I3]|uniref:GNAT family N-acetyltransferase n=1 Tax=Streptomyces sp. B1I3 TaxID=3042264 RepID=UPI00277F2684|nr:GNAT family N-acetyltransferase [Streptomyces sp. B1I3]MDQ0794959.1 ribosomal protein S18 acetylase RimI-like enzyme [Streptomyces sp. B1I3]